MGTNTNFSRQPIFNQLIKFIDKGEIKKIAGNMYGLPFSALQSRNNRKDTYSRRNFIKLTGIGLGSGVLGLSQIACSGGKKLSQPAIQGFEDTGAETGTKVWQPISDRKIRVGLIGYGVCRFAAQFGFQNHPNVEVVAASDLYPDRCAELAKITGAKKTYPSLEELIKDDSIEAVFVATDAPSHARHCIEALKHGKYVASAVPAVFGSLEEAHELFEAVKKYGINKYMMFETSIFRENLYAMRQLYQSGCLGNFVYAEGEYWHYSPTPIDSFNGWRVGLPPQYYPTHSNAYYIGVTGGSFTEVSCLGTTSVISHLKPENNIYNNSFGIETAFLKTNDGGHARMSVSWETPGSGFGSETGRIRGTKGAFYEKYEGLEDNLPDIERPPIPPGMPKSGHGDSHGRLTDEFISSILENRKPLINIEMSLNMTVSGIIAHQSALRDGEWMKIPQYKLSLP